MNPQKPLAPSEQSRYKGRNYFLRNTGKLQPVEYQTIELELVRTGL